MKSLPELEKKIENRVTVFCRKIKLKWKRKQRGELLDRQYYIPGGKIFIIEFKRPGEEPFKRQAKAITELRELGYDIEVHDNSEEAIEAIKARILEAKVGAKERSARDAAKRMSRAFPRSRTR